MKHQNNLQQEPKTQQNKASDDVTTQEVTSTEQPTQEKTQSTSKQEVTTQETSTTEVQPKTNNHKLKNSLNMKLKKHIHKATRKKHLQKKLKTNTTNY